MPKLSDAQMKILQHLEVGKNRLSFSNWQGKYVWSSEAAGPKLNSRSVERLRDLGFVAKEDWPGFRLIITVAGRRFLAEQAGNDV